MEVQPFSSQNPDLNNEQLNKIEQKTRAKNTKKATNWGVKRFEKTRDKKKKKSVDLKGVSPKDLSLIMRKLYAEVMTEKGPA